MFAVAATTSVAEMGEARPTKRVARWYFGGFASVGAACCTHPLDLLKVSKFNLINSKIEVAGLIHKYVRSSWPGCDKK